MTISGKSCIIALNSTNSGGNNYAAAYFNESKEAWR